MNGAVLPSQEARQQAIERIWETIPPLWNRMRGNVRAIASERFGISVQQFRILRHIGAGRHSASELACASQTSRPAVSQCVEALVEKGLVTRRQSRQDRRYVDLSLTADGQEMLDAIFAENHRWLMDKLASLTAGEMDSLLAGLRAIRNAFRE